jgi:hypothetical protein
MLRAKQGLVYFTAVEDRHDGSIEISYFVINSSYLFVDKGQFLMDSIERYEQVLQGSIVFLEGLFQLVLICQHIPFFN